MILSRIFWYFENNKTSIFQTIILLIGVDIGISYNSSGIFNCSAIICAVYNRSVFFY